MDLPPSLIHELLLLLEDLQADVQYAGYAEHQGKPADIQWADFYGARLSIAVRALETLLIDRKETRA